MILNNYRLTNLILRYQLERLGYRMRAMKEEALIEIDFTDTQTADDFKREVLLLKSPLRLDYDWSDKSATIYILSHPRTRADHANGRQQAGRLIAIEGIDGVGKTTIARELEWHLYHRYGIMGRYTSALSEASTNAGSAIGGILRAKPSWNWEAPSPRAEQLAIVAARVDQWDKIIMPCLTQGTWVITDRHAMSGRVYKRKGQSLRSLYIAEQAYDINVEADITYILDLRVDHPRRKGLIKPSSDRLDQRDGNFWEDARSAFHAYGAKPGRYVIDADQPIEDIVEYIIDTMVRAEWLPDRREG